MKLNLFQVFFIGAIILMCSSCSESKVEQGEVTYELTYPYMDTDGFISAVLPQEMTIMFKGTKMKATISRGSFFETNIISDESTNYIAMYSDMDSKQMYCELTPEELKEFKKTLPVYTIEKTSDADSIAGVYSYKYEVDSKDTIQPFDAWFTESFTIQNGAWFTSYADAVGFPLVYDIERYGMFTHAEAVKFKEKEITDKDFQVEGDYDKVSFETYETESKKTFDVLVNW